MLQRDKFNIIQVTYEELLVHCPVCAFPSVPFIMSHFISFKYVGMIGYGMAKAAVHQLVKSLADPSSGLPKNTFISAVLPYVTAKKLFFTSQLMVFKISLRLLNCFYGLNSHREALSSNF